jgi:chaperone required for assembly of F1-ATPase
MKRFYKMVSTQSAPGGFAIELDGKPIKTPSGARLLAGTTSLADAIAVEWSTQDQTIKPATMPLTQILTTKIDQVRTQRAVLEREILKYFDTDLICYRAPIDPQTQDLAHAQQAAWDPWMKWVEHALSCGLETTTGLKALRHSPAAHEAITVWVQNLNEDDFTIVQMLTSISGSLILALAFAQRQLSAAQFFEAMRVEEHFKARLYREDIHGPDPAQAKKDQAILLDVQAAQNYLDLVKS